MKCHHKDCQHSAMWILNVPEEDKVMASCVLHLGDLCSPLYRAIIVVSVRDDGPEARRLKSRLQDMEKIKDEYPELLRKG